MTHNSIIDALTQPVLVAELKKKPDAVRKWRERGHIPSKHWPDVLRVAKAKRLKISAMTLMENQ
jgi:hypothetical protein